MNAAERQLRGDGPQSPRRMEGTARRANLRLNAREREVFRAEFGNVLHFLASLQETEDGPARVLPPCLRADETRPSLSQEEALRGAPEAVDGFFALPEQEGGEEDG